MGLSTQVSNLSPDQEKYLTKKYKSMQKSAAYDVGVITGMAKAMDKIASYYGTQEDRVDEEAGRWNRREKQRGSQGAMDRYKSKGRFGGALVGGITGALTGGAMGAGYGMDMNKNVGKSALVGMGVGALGAGVLGAITGHFAGGSQGKGEKRLANKLKSLNPADRKSYIKKLVRDRMVQEQQMNDLTAAQMGRSNVNVYR